MFLQQPGDGHGEVRFALLSVPSAFRGHSEPDAHSQFAVGLAHHHSTLVAHGFAG